MLELAGMMLTPSEIRHKRRITVAAASKILANLTYAYKGYGLSMGTMLAGVRLNKILNSILMKLIFQL